jgi:hypothetical protein
MRIPLRTDYSFVLFYSVLSTSFTFVADKVNHEEPLSNSIMLQIDSFEEFIIKFACFVNCVYLFVASLRAQLIICMFV